MNTVLTRISVVLMLLLAVVPLRADEDQAKKAYVLVIGIDKYADQQIKPRTHAEADAKALYDVLSQAKFMGGTQVESRLLLGTEDAKRNSQPATHENIVKGFKWVAQAGSDDMVVIAMFMQGAPLGTTGCYFATDSTYKNRNKDAVSAAEIKHELDTLKCKRVVVFVDVNFNGFDSGKEKPPGINLAEYYQEFLGDEDKGTNLGRFVLLANSGTRQSLEGEEHGLFAQVLLDALRGKADKAGYEPDGLVTTEEIIEYFEDHLPELIRTHGKTEEDKRQRYLVLRTQQWQFAVTHNPAVTAKVNERLQKLEELAKKKAISEEVAEEGRHLLYQMPRLKARQELRKQFQALVEGKLAVDDFLKARDKILAGMKITRDDAETFAEKIMEGINQVRDDYVEKLNQGEMVGWAIEGLFRYVNQNIPKEFKERLKKVKELSQEELLKLLADVRQHLGKREDLDEHKDIDVALQRMLANLDPYTTYIDPATLARFRQETEARFTGVGIQIRKDLNTDQLLVVTPLYNSPAYKKGIKAGDLIVEIRRDVDSEGNKLPQTEVIPTKGLPLSDAVKKILGREGTQVRLLIKREGVEKPFEVEITRGLVQVETVLGARRKDDDTWDYLIDHANRIGYVRITSFANRTAEDLDEVLAKLQKRGIKGFILDLRFNPGGLLSSAVIISDMFIDDGRIVSIRPRGANERFLNGEHDRSLLDFPMVCLVNGGSASGSEIVAACLQDHNRALIVGERSYGKGSVQNIRNFEGGQLKLTTATFWRPSGKNLNRASTKGRPEDEWGVIPDKNYLVELTAKQRQELQDHLHEIEIIGSKKKPNDKFEDIQLNKALEYLRKQIQMADKSKRAG
ncbi:MAG: hypothetical protein KatS3mg105_0173 [Gemmatales bacterium]|nr:MAG: hypothetical protein KatS3mg105_0173 [Gemmatales bacterium]